MNLAKLTNLVLCLILSLVSFYASAEDFRTISGTVHDANGNPLPGAVVMQTGSSNGAITGMEGEFSINVSVEEAEIVLEVSLLGYVTKSFALSENQNYLNAFLAEDAIQTEVILARDYNQALSVFHSSNYFATAQSMGQPGMTRKLVASYLMSDGSRFTDIAGWETMQFAAECENRDPRLAQSIRTPGYTRIGENTPVLPDFSGSVTGYQQIKYVTTTDCDRYEASYNDLIIFRLGEIYLNFAEAKAELETLTQDDLDKSVNKLRDRVGMPHMSLADANANPDPYLMAAETGYPGVSGTNQGVILEIRRERTIELAQEGFRYYDIIRWKEGQAFNQQFYGMYFPGPGEYDLDGDGNPDLYLWEGTQGSTTASVSLEISAAIFLSEGSYGYVTPHPEKQESWVEERDYLYPIPIDDRSLTGGALTQNPGWNDGLSF